MNERIQELVNQAKDSIPKDTLTVNQWLQAYNQKFAHLIIQECIDQCFSDLDAERIATHFDIVIEEEEE